MNDIVERLSSRGEALDFSDDQLMQEAANEIERLRAALKADAALIDEGLEVLTNLTDSIQRHGNYSAESTVCFIDSAASAFREARATLKKIGGGA